LLNDRNEAMGGGTRYRNDVPKARVLDLLQAVRAVQAAGGASGALADATEFCVRSHSVTFALEPATGVPELGAHVRLAMREGALMVVTGSTALGRVMSPPANALMGCLHIGFSLEGVLEEVDPDTGTGRVAVSGMRAKAA
jgi:hypothetical protein